MVVLSSRKQEKQKQQKEKGEDNKQKKMADIFDNPILCRNCNSRMKKSTLEKDGFLIRAVVCDKCRNKIIHPNDEAEYHRFTDLKNKEFRVKMRLVGNSYAVSIPKEIVSFIREMQEQEKKMNEKMSNMVRLCFEDFGRLSLNFDNNHPEEKNSRVVKAREVKLVKNGKPVLHSREFYDSANPKNNKAHLKINKFADEENDR